MCTCSLNLWLENDHIERVLRKLLNVNYVLLQNVHGKGKMYVLFFGYGKSLILVDLQVKKSNIYIFFKNSIYQSHYSFFQAIL